MSTDRFESYRNEKSGTAVWTVLLAFPEFDGLPTKSFKWATQDNIELEDLLIYSKQLSSVPTARHQKDIGNDYAEFQVANPTHQIHAAIYPYQDALELAEVTIRECYEIEKDYFESEIVFFGYCKDFTVDDSQATINFSAISDMSRDKHLVGGRVITRERCGTIYSFGLIPADTLTACTWQTIQGGNPNHCSKFFTGIDSCTSHNNTHQFFAVSGLSNATLSVTQLLNGFVGGFDYSTRDCFTENTLVLMANGTTKPINKIKCGDLVMAYDVFDNDKLIHTRVKKVYKTLKKGYSLATFKDSIYEVTKGHLFYVGKQNFAPVRALKGRSALGIDSNRNVLKTPLLTIRDIPDEEVYLYNFTTEDSTYIVTDRFERVFNKIHNIKAFVDYSYNNYYNV